MTRANEVRDGEVLLPHGIGATDDAGLVFVGRIRTPWARGDCPRNLRAARERIAAEGHPRPRIELDPRFALALTALQPGQPVMLLYWLDGARRDLVVQAPAHADGPRGTFALRSPVRPNPIGAATVIVTALDLAAATLEIDAIDCFDDTPLLDIKPWLETVDMPPARA
ncbi:MAG: SAM-dependent methyltransferase [Maritimibacter sp.]|nr:SAM-dependent methyltransferase [Maritimibacter sp.]MCC2100243.1 SAM-dependent methyltransferase [Hyphomicrobiales bacterium]